MHIVKSSDDEKCRSEIIVRKSTVASQATSTPESATSHKPQEDKPSNTYRTVSNAITCRQSSAGTNRRTLIRRQAIK